MMPSKPHAGMALIIVVGTLCVLSILALAFTTMTALERRASEHRNLSSRAYLLARSGLEDAMARIALGQDMAYGGENWDASPDGRLSSKEAQSELYRRTGAGTPADQDACPALQAMRPCFPVAPRGIPPVLVGVDRRERAFSGHLRGNFQRYGNHYAVKAAGGGFFVNGGDPAAAPTAGLNAVLGRMLGTLAEAIDREDGKNDGLPVDEPDGWALVVRRPSSGWQSLRQIRDMALGLSEDKLAALREYLTLVAWVDLKVVAPNAAPAMVNKGYVSQGAIKLDRPVQAGNPKSRAPDFERLGGRIVGRAPVALAWARTRRPALVALVAGLRGVYLDESAATNLTAKGGQPGIIGHLREAVIANTWSPTDECSLVVDAIRGSKASLSTWQEWHAFCDTLPVKGSAQAVRAKRDILKANFNPNTSLNKFNPNRSTWRSVDKSDLLVYSTELSLQPVQVRELECAGRVIGPGGRLLAAKVLRMAITPPTQARLTTQREFVCASLGDLDVAGDEQGVRLPGEAAFLSAAQGTSRAWGHALPKAPPGGFAVQSYPEPCVSPGKGLFMNPADYDGSLQLGTVETSLDQWYSVRGNVRNMMLLARFDDAFDLDVGNSGAAYGRANHLDRFQVATQELGNSLLDAAKINTLYPDGAFSETDRSPAWCDRGNAHGYRGLCSFWFKPDFTLSKTGNPRSRQLVHLTNYADKNRTSPKDQFFGMFWTSQAIQRRQGKGWVIERANQAVAQFEIGHDTNDMQREHRFATPVLPAALPDPAHRWGLMTLFWDLRAPLSHDTGELIMDDGDRAYEVASNDTYWGQGMNAADSATDLTSDEPIGRHLVCLGRHGRPIEYIMSGYVGSGVETTFDEFAFYDFGGAEPKLKLQAPPGPMPASFAKQRYLDGRYYPETTWYAPAASGPGEAASWTSPPLSLPPGSRLEELRWTLMTPAELPNDYVAWELLDASGAGWLFKAEASSRSTRAPGFSRASQAWQVNRLVPGPFRLRAVFLSAGRTAGAPLLDSPVLDDVTLVHAPASGARIARWQEGGE